MSKLYTLDELKAADIEPCYFGKFHPDDRFDDNGEKVIETKIPINWDVKNTNFHLSDVKTEIKCNQCGSTKFIVGKGKYFTAIKCETCRWEMTIHEG